MWQQGNESSMQSAMLKDSDQMQQHSGSCQNDGEEKKEKEKQEDSNGNQARSLSYWQMLDKVDT
jgi:hypothetical protein